MIDPRKLSRYDRLYYQRIRNKKLLNSSLGFGAEQAIPLRDLEPGSVGTWPAASSTQREDLKYSETQLKADLIKSSFFKEIN